MLLEKILNNIKTIYTLGNLKIDINALCYDSRKANKDSVFFAIKGLADDGHKYISKAIEAGAKAIVFEDETFVESIPKTNLNVFIKVKDSRKALALASKNFYDDPTSKLNLIGITGTKGKTTTAFLIKSVLDLNGIKSGLIGTIANYIGDEKIKASLTTPESLDALEMMDLMLKRNCKAAAMEVSSHSLELDRVYGFNFLGGVFTNITSDHMDFHITFENYFKAKKKLFDCLGEKSFAIINADDPNSNKIIENCKAKILSYSTINKNSVVYISDIDYDLTETRFVINYEAKSYKAKINLAGEFNAYNAAAAFLLGVALGLNPENVISSLAKAEQVPGRFETITNGKKIAIIDYAHTADSLEKTLMAIRKISKGKNKIYTVFGCGGNRDKTKRPIMGDIATRLSDFVVITSDNPRFEEPEQIINDIVAGIKSGNYKKDPDRESAIKWAIENSPDDAIILIAGKGHEDYQIVKDKRINFSDSEVAKKYFGI